MGIFARITERMDRQSHLMGAMMERLAVDIDGVSAVGSGAGLQAAARSCLMCAGSEECQRWLEKDDGTQPDFCPNARFFADHRK